MAVVGNKLIVDPTTGPAGTQWLLDEGYIESCVIYAGGSGNEFGQVLGGTVLGQITGSGKFRPVGKAVLDAAVDADTEIDVTTDGTATLRNGDVVDILSKLGLKGSLEMSDLDGTPASGESIDLESKELDGLAHRVTITDPGDTDQSLVVTSTFDPATGIRTVNVSLATDGGGASTTTLNDIIDAINAEAGDAIRASLTDGATGTTVCVVGSAGNYDLAGGYAPGDTIASSRTLSARDTEAGTFTISGAAITAAAGDIVQLSDGSETAVGFLRDTVQTAEPYMDAAGDFSHFDQGGVIVFNGAADASECVGLNVETTADLAAKWTLR